MKILIVSQYFWPENFRINELAEELIKNGHKVTILTGLPNYPEGEIFEEFRENKLNFSIYKGIKIIRVPIYPRKKGRINLILNYLSFLISGTFYVILKLRKKKFDFVFTFQLSPITAAIPSIFYSLINKSVHILWVLDLWPDTLIDLGILKNKFKIRFFRIFVNWIYRRSDIILAQSKSFVANIKKSIPYKKNIYYFPSWGELNLFTNEVRPTNEIKPSNKFTILFAGNIGEAQDFESVIKAVKILSSKKINNFRIVILGEGSKKKWLINEIKNLGIDSYFEIKQKYPLEKMPSFFYHADALLVSLLDRNGFNMTIPGKIPFYLSSGIPIVGMINGEGSRIIKEAKAGFVCEASNYLELSNLILKMSFLDKNELKEIGKNGKSYCEKEFSKTKQVSRLLAIFENFIE